jgi:hypothetical protein
VPSAADKAELWAKTGPVADDIVRTRPELRPLWDLIKVAATLVRAAHSPPRSSRISADKGDARINK